MRGKKQKKQGNDFENSSQSQANPMQVVKAAQPSRLLGILNSINAHMHPILSSFLKTTQPHSIPHHNTYRDSNPPQPSPPHPRSTLCLLSLVTTGLAGPCILSMPASKLPDANFEFCLISSIGPLAFDPSITPCPTGV